MGRLVLLTVCNSNNQRHNNFKNCNKKTLSLPVLAMNADIQDSSHGAEREDTWFEKKYGRLTNLQILIITSVLFTLFVVAEIVGALVSV